MGALSYWNTEVSDPVKFF